MSYEGQTEGPRKIRDAGGTELITYMSSSVLMLIKEVNFVRVTCLQIKYGQKVVKGNTYLRLLKSLRNSTMADRYFNVICSDPVGRLGEAPTPKLRKQGRISGACFDAARFPGLKRFYLIGSDRKKKYFRVLKIDRVEPSDLNISEDPVVYPSQEVKSLLQLIAEGNHVTGGLKVWVRRYMALSLYRLH